MFTRNSCLDAYCERAEGDNFKEKHPLKKKKKKRESGGNHYGNWDLKWEVILLWLKLVLELQQEGNDWDDYLNQVRLLKITETQRFRRIYQIKNGVVLENGDVLLHHKISEPNHNHVLLCKYISGGQFGICRLWDISKLHIYIVCLKVLGFVLLSNHVLSGTVT